MAGSDAKGLREGLTTVTFGTVALVLATLCLVGLNFVARVLVVRGLGNGSPELNGFLFGFTLTQVLVAVGSLGIPVWAARSLPSARTDAERNAVVRVAFWTGGIAAAAAGASLALAGPLIAGALHAPDLVLGLEFFAVAVASLIASTVLASIFQGFTDVRPNAVFVQVLNPALFLAFLGAALLLPPGHVTYLAALVGYAGANAATLVALFVYTARKLPSRLVRTPPAPLRRIPLAWQIAPIAVLGAMVILAGAADTLVLGAYHYVEVANYAVSVTLARLIQVGINAAAYIFLPVAARFVSRKDSRAVRLTYATVTKWLTVFSLPLFAVFFFLPSTSLAFVYGPDFGSVVLPLEITVLGAFAGTLLGPGTVAQVAVGDTRLVAYNSVAGGVADIAIALVLVPAYGSVGAAVAWASANVLIAGLCVAELAVLRGIHPFGRDFLAPLVASVVPVAGVLALVHPHVPLLGLPVLALLVAGVFLLAVVLTRSVGEGDRLLLEAVEGWTGRRIPGVRWLGRLAGGVPPARPRGPLPSDGDGPRPP